MKKFFASITKREGRLGAEDSFNMGHFDVCSAYFQIDLAGEQKTVPLYYLFFPLKGSSILVLPSAHFSSLCCSPLFHFSPAVDLIKAWRCMCTGPSLMGKTSLVRTRLPNKHEPGLIFCSSTCYRET